ncbi:MAG TPA: cupin domain-containing protein [Candidatus Saccharimonadales bacterium]|nr:cupin domain-containing protein [Candidatus Saccharimonadales bacterium]
MNKLAKANAIQHGREGVKGWYYQLPEINKGTTVAYAEFTDEHGERTIGERSRIYYILEGKGEFVVNGEKFSVEKGDLIPIPPLATYNLWPTKGPLKVLLYMEFLDFGK